MKTSALIFIMMLAVSVAFASKNRSRILELFIWKVSDKLELKVDVENKFSTTIRKLDEAKENAQDKSEQILSKMSQESDGKKQAELLKEYEKSQKELNQIKEKEVTELTQILGPSKMVQYLVIKRDLNNRLKELVSRPEGMETSKGRVQSEPQIIEEK